MHGSLENIGHLSDSLPSLTLASQTSNQRPHTTAETGYQRRYLPFSVVCFNYLLALGNVISNVNVIKIYNELNLYVACELGVGQ